MTWNQQSFDEALKRKYEILGQNADAETTRANAAMQNVQQQPGLQQQQDDAVMRRAQLAADTSLQTAGMNNDAMMNRARLAADTSLQTAGMGNALEQNRMTQQDRQFASTYALDAAKAREDSLLKRAGLSRDEMGKPFVNPETQKMTDWTKRYGLSPTDIGKSPLDTVGGYDTPDWAKKRLGQL